MTIVCPHCMTSYAVDPANFGPAGRRVRCARCHEVWLATPQDLATADAMAGYGTGQPDADFEVTDRAPEPWREDQAPHIDSPSISADWPEPEHSPDNSDHNWAAMAREDQAAEPPAKTSSRLRNLASRLDPYLKPSVWANAVPSAVTLPTVCVALGAVVFTLIVWRSDVVRLMPQTAAFYRMVGMGVNLRGLQFQDVKITTETVDNKAVLLIEGAITDVAHRPMEIPRLRFIVRDASGADIYAWNAVLEQSAINPGEKAWFKTRLASPPAEGREIAVRFFHQRDLMAGGS